MDETNYTLHQPPHRPPNQPTNPGPGHETKDINIRAVGKFVFGLIVVCLLSSASLFGLMKFFQSHEATSRANTVDPVKLFPQPQLERTPVMDLQAMRAEEDKLLNGYAWVDPQKGLVRIPIDQAISVLAKRGLPSRAKSDGPGIRPQGQSK